MKANSLYRLLRPGRLWVKFCFGFVLLGSVSNSYAGDYFFDMVRDNMALPSKATSLAQVEDFVAKNPLSCQYMSTVYQGNAQIYQTYEFPTDFRPATETPILYLTATTPLQKVLVLNQSVSSGPMMTTFDQRLQKVFSTVNFGDGKMASMEFGFFNAPGEAFDADELIIYSRFWGANYYLEQIHDCKVQKLNQ